MLTLNRTKVVSVRVTDIRPQYNNLYEWMQDPNNVYIGRKCIVFINGSRYPPNDSIWANPYKDGDNIVGRYREYIINELNTGKISLVELNKLRGKTLGCWCKTKGLNIPCHGDVLLELLLDGKYLVKI